MSSGTMRALLTASIDYAGLFPPAAQPMLTVAANYDEYSKSSDAWALGRLIVPAVRLQELLDTAARRELSGMPWRVSAIIGADVAKDAERIVAFNDAARGAMLVDMAEARVAAVGEVASLMRVLAPLDALFIEFPLAQNVAVFLDAIAAAGAKAKIRTGGTTPDAFPSAVDVARFLIGCRARTLSFKATAGLHHPVCGAYPLTYEAGAARSTMYGFLNVMLASALAYSNADASIVTEMLGESDGTMFHFDESGVDWRGRRISRDNIEETRAQFFLSFGSCSFREPLDDLLELGHL